MQVSVSNNIRIRGAPVPLRAMITKALTVDNPQYKDRKNKRLPTWGISQKLQLYIQQGTDLILPRGFLTALEEMLRTVFPGGGYEYVLLTGEGMEADFGEWTGPQLWAEQAEALHDVLAGGNGILVAPAGSGKTNMGMGYVKVKHRAALWLTHTKDLLYQSAERARQVLGAVGDVGIIGDGKVHWGSGKLIVATVQTLQERPDLVKALDDVIGTVVIDEAHHFPAPAFIEVAGKFKAKNMLGITATPDRKDRLEVYMYTGIGPKLHSIDRQKLYDTGRLVMPRVEFIYTSFAFEQASDRNELNNVDAGGEDLDYIALTRALIADPPRAELIARNIIKAANQFGYSIVITESVRYCYVLQQAVKDLLAKENLYIGPMEVIHGPISRYTWRAAKTEKNALAMVTQGKAKNYRHHKTLGWQVEVEQYTEAEFLSWQISNSQRKEILARAARKEIHVLFATQLAREGLDMPHLTVGHLAMPKRGDASDSKNGASVEQEIGRIMRYDPQHPDKKAVWYDYVDYNVGVYQSQYQSRRSVYKRLGITLPIKPKTRRDEIEEFLSSMPY